MSEVRTAPFHLQLQRFTNLRAHILTVGLAELGFRELECVLCPVEAQHQIFDLMTRVAMKVAERELDLSIVSEQMTAVYGGDFGILKSLGFTLRGGRIRVILPDAKGQFLKKDIDRAYQFQWDPIELIGFAGMDVDHEVASLNDSLDRMFTVAGKLTSKYGSDAVLRALICAVIDSQTMNKKIVQALGKRGLIDNTDDLGFDRDEEIQENIVHVLERFAHAFRYSKSIHEVADIPREDL